MARRDPPEALAGHYPTPADQYAELARLFAVADLDDRLTDLSSRRPWDGSESPQRYLCWLVESSRAGDFAAYVVAEVAKAPAEVVDYLAANGWHHTHHEDELVRALGPYSPDYEKYRRYGGPHPAEPAGPGGPEVVDVDFRRR